MAIDGMDDWMKKLETMKKDFPKETGRFLMKKAEETIKYAKKYPGHKSHTGVLKGGWQRQNGGSFKQIIYNNASYAAHVEYGHRIVRNKETIGFVRGRRMLHRAMNRTKLSFYKDLGTVYKNLIEK